MKLPSKAAAAPLAPPSTAKTSLSLAGGISISRADEPHTLETVHRHVSRTTGASHGPQPVSETEVLRRDPRPGTGEKRGARTVTRQCTPQALDIRRLEFREERPLIDRVKVLHRYSLADPLICIFNGVWPLHKVHLLCYYPCMATHARALTEADALTRSTIPGLKAQLSERRLRRIAHGRKEFFHRTKNGVYDPLTYFHVLDALLNYTNEPFRTREFIHRLNETHPQLVWDTTTVGRVLNDISETISEQNPTFLTAVRSYDGMRYTLAASLEAHTAMLRLLDDLYLLSDNLIFHEVAGDPPKRLNSPLLQCPSANPGAEAIVKVSRAKTV